MPETRSSKTGPSGRSVQWSVGGEVRLWTRLLQALRRLHGYYENSDGRSGTPSSVLLGGIVSPLQASKQSQSQRRDGDGPDGPLEYEDSDIALLPDHPSQS